jgi:hypothetical protein
MSDDRPWYREPETFIALAALIVSVTAVVVGIYEAHLQRVHDRAEVWPRLEVSTFIESIGVKITLDNTGLGPAIIQSIIVTVDSAPQRDWLGTFKAVTGIAPTHYSNSTAANRSLRAGDHIDLFSVGAQDLKPGFWDYATRIRLQVCYTSIFGEAWLLSSHVGGADVWKPVKDCPAQPAHADF